MLVSLFMISAASYVLGVASLLNITLNGPMLGRRRFDWRDIVGKNSLFFFYAVFYAERSPVTPTDSYVEGSFRYPKAMYDTARVLK